MANGISAQQGYSLATVVTYFALAKSLSACDHEIADAAYGLFAFSSSGHKL